MLTYVVHLDEKKAQTLRLVNDQFWNLSFCFKGNLSGFFFFFLAFINEFYLPIKKIFLPFWIINSMIQRAITTVGSILGF